MLFHTEFSGQRKDEFKMVKRMTVRKREKEPKIQTRYIMSIYIDISLCFYKFYNFHANLNLFITAFFGPEELVT